MISVEEARDLAGERLRRRLATWATSPVECPTMTIGLKPPSEQVVRSDELAAEQWVRGWDAVELPEGVELDWQVRVWRSVGRQRVPVRLRLDHPDGVATFAGGGAARRWRVLTRRRRQVRAALGESAAIDNIVRKHAALLVEISADRFTQIVGASQWLSEHHVDGLRPRQIPIRGVDSKWFTANRSIVSALVEAATDRTHLEIKDADRLVRMRVLDPHLAPAGLTDLAVPAAQLGALELGQRVTFVFENLESVLAMPEWPGAVVVHGSGYAVDVVAELPWVRRAPIVYWGDLDSHGFAILHRLRVHVPGVMSVLMDVDTLLSHRDLWVPEPQPSTATLTTLTDEESATYSRLRDEGNVRLEQERIPWATALDALRRRVDDM